MAKKQPTKEEATKEQTPMAGLTPGRMVHYVMNEDTHRAAVITAVADGVVGIVHLSVFMDGENDGYAPGALGRASNVRHDPERAEGTWHWIEQA